MVFWMDWGGGGGGGEDHGKEELGQEVDDEVGANEK